MKIRYFPISIDKPDTLVSANDGKLKVHGMTTVCVSIGGYVCNVDFLVVDDLNVNCILGLSMLKANQADVKLSDSTLTLQNGLTAVPLITRFWLANVGAAYCMYDNSSESLERVERRVPICHDVLVMTYHVYHVY